MNGFERRHQGHRGLERRGGLVVACVLAIAVVLSAVVAAGCGGSGGTPAVGQGGGATSMQVLTQAQRGDLVETVTGSVKVVVTNGKNTAVASVSQQNAGAVAVGQKATVMFLRAGANGQSGQRGFPTPPAGSGGQSGFPSLGAGADGQGAQGGVPPSQGRSTSLLSSMKRRNTQDSSQCTPAWVMTWSTQVSKVSAVRSASRAACHSACRLVLSSVTSSMRRSRSSSRRLSECDHPIRWTADRVR